MLSARRREGGRASTSAAGASATAGGEGSGDDDEGNDGEAGEQAAGGALGVDVDDEASVCGALFKGLVFFLAREVPREPLLLVIR